MKSFKYIIFLFLAFLLTSCENYLDVGVPKDEVAAELAFTDDKLAAASVTGVFTRMNQLNYQFANVLSMMLPAMQADEFVYAFTSATYDEFKSNAPLSSNRYVGILWSQPYQYIAQANMCIEGLEASTALSPEVKKHLIGEAKFIRAFCYFYLVNNYGDVPLVTGTDVAHNNTIGRTPAAQVYTAIIDDLKDAKSRLAPEYANGARLDGSGERIRPNKSAASALLARTYLYTEQWDLAEAEASEVINNPLYRLLPTASLNNVFLKNSEEAIWQLQPVNTGGGRNTWEGSLIVPVNITTGNPLFRLVPGYLYDAFESGDQRHEHWVGKITLSGQLHKFPYKYKVRAGVTPVQEYSMVLRLAEQYLIRAEARFEQNKLAEAQADINVIRQRAGLDDLDLGNNVNAIRQALEQERRVELFAEWGHRWYDLRRWPSLSGAAGKTRADDILPSLKPGWQSDAIYLPLPDEAVKTNPAL